MATFNFGTSPAPAPTGGGGGGFGFGSGPAPSPFGAPASSSGGGGGGFGGFGAPSSSSSTGYQFGGSSSTTPAPSFAFGSTAANTPAPNFGSAFGGGASGPTSTSAFGFPPAPSGGLFGGAPSAFGVAAPAPLFGGAPAFGASPAATGFNFGASPSPFGAPPPAFGTANVTAASTATPIPAISGHMTFASIPPEYQQAIDRLHNAIMTHQRTMNHLSGMVPTMPSTQSLKHSLLQLQQSLASTNLQEELKVQERNVTASYVYAQWPLEAVAVRHGMVKEEKKDTDLSGRIRELLDAQLAHVDRLERLPSPYLVECVKEWQSQVDHLHGQLQLAVLDRPLVIEDWIGWQDKTLQMLSTGLGRLHAEMETTRRMYRVIDKSETNVLDRADRLEQEQRDKVEQALLLQYVQAGSNSAADAAGAPTPWSTPAAPPTTAAPSMSSTFSLSANPAPSTFSFSGTPSSPATGFSFGSGTGPAPTTTTTTFGAPNTTTAPPAGVAPASAFSFSTLTSKKKSSSRSGGRMTKR